MELVRPTCIPWAEGKCRFPISVLSHVGFCDAAGARHQVLGTDWVCIASISWPSVEGSHVLSHWALSTRRWQAAHNLSCQGPRRALFRLCAKSGPKRHVRQRQCERDRGKKVQRRIVNYLFMMQMLHLPVVVNHAANGFYCERAINL